MNSTNEALLFQAVKQLFEEYIKQGMTLSEAHQHIEGITNCVIDQYKAQRYFFKVGLKKER